MPLRFSSPAFARLVVVSFFVCSLFQHRAVAASAQYRVTSPAPTAGWAGSYPGPAVALNATTSIFMAESADSADIAFWSTDGTEAGTHLFATLPYPPEDDPGYSTVKFGYFKNVGDGRTTFAAWDATNGNQLWITDGTAAGTKRLTTNAYPNYFGWTVARGSKLLYVAGDNSRSTLWQVDLITGATELVVDLNPGGDASISSVQEFGPDLLIAGWNGTAERFARIAGGIVSSFGPQNAWRGLASGNTRYLITLDSQTYDSQLWSLWKTDGTDAGTTLVMGGLRELNVFSSLDDGRILFVTNDGVHGQELWSSDGTTAGTKILADLNPGRSGSNATIVKGLHGDRYISAEDGSSHSLIYRFTPATNTLAPLYSGIRVEEAGREYKGYWYFCGSDQEHGRAIWRTDGTSAGTQLFAGFHPKFEPDTYLLDTAGDFLLFRADDGIHGVEPWITDGSAAGTKLLHDCLAVASQDSNPQLAGVIGMSVLFTALGRVDVNGISIRDLYKSDGTTGGTTIVTALDSTPVDSFVSNGSNVYYTRRDATPKLFATDGTADGTRALANVTESPTRITPFRNGAAFVGPDADGHARLYVTDGSVAGTQPVTSSSEIIIGRLAPTTTYVYFFVAGVTTELWRSDGTAGGTARVISLPAIDPSTVSSFVNIGEKLFFYTPASSQLWRSDGTAGGTAVIATVPSLTNLWNVNGSLFALAGDKLWKSVGGESAPVLVKERITEAAPVAGGSVVAGSMLYWFSSHLRGSQLWRSDGTTEGTYPVVHFYNSAPTPSRLPARLGYANGQLFFPGYDRFNGAQLWTSNGTREGTHAVIGLHSGGQTPPAEFLTAGSRVFFPRVNDYYGTQLWAVDATSPISLPTPPALAVTDIVTTSEGLNITGASAVSQDSPAPVVINFAFCGATDYHNTAYGSSTWVLTNHPDLSYVPIPVNPGTTDIYITGITYKGVSNEITLTMRGPVSLPAAPPATPSRRRAAN